MAPIHLFPLLEIYCLVDLKDAPYVRKNNQAIQELIRAEFVKPRMSMHPDPEIEKGRIPWQLTEKGRAYVDGLTNLPEPIREWRIPHE